MWAQKNWEYVGPNEMKSQVKGMITAVWCNSVTPNIVFAGSATGGLFKSENALDSVPVWKNISDTYLDQVFGVSDIVIKSNSHEQEIFISTCSKSAISKAYGHGILYTNNGGISWKKVGPGKEKDNTFALNGLVVNSENENEMLAYDSHLIYLTSDNWNTYKTIDVGLAKNDKDVSLCDIEFAPYEKGKFYACTRTNNKYESKLFSIENYGVLINDITPANIKSERLEVATIKNPAYKGKFYMALGWIHVYVQYYNGNKYSGNLNKQAINQVYAGAYWNFELSVNQVDTNILYLSMTETSRSLDGGKTFHHISNYNGVNTHADNRAQILLQSSEGGKNDKLLLGNDGGVSLNTTGLPFKWKNLNGKGLDVNQFWGISVLQSDSLVIAGGTADNGGFIFWKNEEINSMGACGDGYLAQVTGQNEMIIQCNTPSIFYHNLKNKSSVYLNVYDNRYDGKRPMCLHDSFVYVGYSNCWRIGLHELRAGKTNFTKFSNIPDVLNKTGGIKNGAIKAMAIGPTNEGLIAFKDPNWGDIENTGKFYHCRDLNNNVWIDISNEAVCNGFAICQWSEINTLIFDGKEKGKFYFVSRDVNNQSNSRLFEMKYFNDSLKYKIREIGFGLPNVGINDLCIDQFSRVLYLASDKGIFYGDLNADSLVWKIFANSNTLPLTLIFDLDINYVNNTLYAGTFGRGIWKTTLVYSNSERKTIKKNSVFKTPFKVDGELVLKRKRELRVNSKLILTPNSKIKLNRKSKLIIEDKNLIRNERNEITDIHLFMDAKSKTHPIFIK